MTKPIIHVVVITYNQEKYISQCIESILQQQTNACVQILIGDDASQDRTGDILEQYAASYPDKIQLIRRRVNIGASANLKDLIERASGDYIAFCEGDDFWIDPQKIERQRHFLSENPNLAGCTHDIILVDENNRLLDNQHLQWVRSKDIYSMRDFDLSKLPGHLSSLLIRNTKRWKAMEKSLLLCDRNSSDSVLFFLLLTLGNIGRLSRKMSAYRFVRSYSGNNLVAEQYANRSSSCVRDLKKYSAMECLLKRRGIRKTFVAAQSRILVTALFHKVKGYDISLKEVWKMCSHPWLAAARFPVAFAEQFFKKIQILTGRQVR